MNKWVLCFVICFLLPACSPKGEYTATVAVVSNATEPMPTAALSTAIPPTVAPTDIPKERPAHAEADTGSWVYQEDINPADGSKSNMIAVSAKRHIQGADGSYLPWFGFRCVDTQLLAVLSTEGSPLSVDDSGVLTDISLRFGDEPDVKQTVNVITTLEGAMFMYDDLPGTIKQNDTLVLTFKPQGGELTEATFALRGFEEAMKPVFEACETDWSEWD